MSHLIIQLSDLPKIIIAETNIPYFCGRV